MINQMGKTVDNLNKERSKCYEEIYERYVKQDFTSSESESSKPDDEFEEMNKINEKIYNEMISFTNENCFPLCECRMKKYYF